MSYFSTEGFLTSSSIASLIEGYGYLTSASASSTYLTNSSAASSYLVSASITTLIESYDYITSASAESGGYSPAVYYALGSGTSNLGTALGDVPFATAVKADTGYTASSDAVVIGADLDGKWARVCWAVGGSGAINRVELRSELQVDTGIGYTRVKGSDNYTARDSIQDRGGVQGMHIIQVNTGNKLKIQALRQGSTCNLVADATHFSIETLD